MSWEPHPQAKVHLITAVWKEDGVSRMDTKCGLDNVRQTARVVGTGFQSRVNCHNCLTAMDHPEKIEEPVSDDEIEW
ncbi:MAG: hypothetical protein GTO63_07325 [Anaerolineae bacterium]|nr:hypothetical protein [Anaerolineae bacterium]